MKLIVPYLVVVLLPAIEALYFAGIHAGSRTLEYDYDSRYRYLFHSAFVCTVGGLVLGFTSVEAPLGEPNVAYVALLAVGAGLYYTDTFVWMRATGNNLRRGDRQALWVLPTLATPIGEEILFRGVFLPVVDSFGVVGYVVVSSAVFGMSHVTGGRREVAFKTLNGVVYAGLFLATGSILAPIITHVGYNGAYLHLATQGGSNQ